MAMALDHVLIAASKGAPEVEPLLAAGFAEGPPNVHPGQGTACRRIFFENAYLEFAWIENDAEVCSSLVSPTGLGERLGGLPGVSRLGFCVQLPEGKANLPVKTWPYQPPYLPTGVSIPMAWNSSKLDEPLLFFLPHELSRKRNRPKHPNGAGVISRVSVELPSAIQLSNELRWLAHSRLAAVELGRRESLRVELAGGTRGGHFSLMVASPVELIW